MREMMNHARYIHGIIEDKSRLYDEYLLLFDNEVKAIKEDDLVSLRTILSNKNRILQDVGKLDEELEGVKSEKIADDGALLYNEKLKNLVYLTITKIKDIMEREEEIRKMLISERDRTESELLDLRNSEVTLGGYFQTAAYKPRFVDISK